jgi:hypothetical protein
MWFILNSSEKLNHIVLHVLRVTVTDEKCRMYGSNILGAEHFTALSYDFFLMINCGDLLLGL